MALPFNACICMMQHNVRRVDRDQAFCNQIAQQGSECKMPELLAAPTLPGQHAGQVQAGPRLTMPLMHYAGRVKGQHLPAREVAVLDSV